MTKGKFKKKLPKDQSKQNKVLKKQDKEYTYVDLLGLVIIFILGIIIYSNSFICPFQFDDSIHIIDNKIIRDLSGVQAMWNYSHRRFIDYYSFAINYHFGALNVWGYHLFNLIIHLINASLAWWLTLLIFSSPVLKDHPLTRHKKVIAFFTGLLFVSHPLATESVVYIVQRMASMVTMFYLLSLALYVKARLPGKRNASKYLLFAGSFVSAVLAMLTKENAFTLPLVVLLIDIFFLQKKKLAIHFKNYRVILLIVVSLGVVLLALLKLSLIVFKPIPPSLGNAYTVTSLNYFFTQFSVIVKYIQLLFLPLNQNLDYDWPISDHFFEVRTVLSFLVLLSLIILSIFLFNRNRIISFGILWFFLGISVESSFVPLEDLIFEHRTYLPSFGFFLILTTGIFGLLWNKYKYLAIAVLSMIVGTNSYLTHERNKVWKDELSLWSDVVLKSPHKARPLGTLGDCYRNLGQKDKAIAEYTHAIQINPQYSTAYHNRGGIYGTLGQWDKAIIDYSTAIKIDPSYKRALYNRGNAYAKVGQKDKAIEDYTGAIRIDSTFTFAYYARSIAYGNLNQWDKALEDGNKAIETDTTYAPAISNRGFIYFSIGQMGKAIDDYSRAIAIDPTFSGSYSNRGVAYDKLGKWDLAIADYTKAIDIDPKNANNYYNRGVAYGNLGQWAEAIENYSKAIEIDPNKTNAIINRDQAYNKLQSGKKQ